MNNKAVLLLFLTSANTIFAQNKVHENVNNNLNQNVIHYLEKPVEIRKEVVPIKSDSVVVIKKIKVENPYKDYLASIPSILPLKNVGKKYFISSFYQKRMHPIDKQYKMHYGIDLSAPKGTPVFASANGIVTNIYYNRTDIGYAIKIKHSYKYSTLYGHLDRLPYFQLFDSIKRGQIIAYVGNTGLSTAPHLHYCVYYNNKPINPLQYITLISK
jgi:murein DD-endopeptidase MepM/ murein hydrolase activator NlpD